MKSKKNLRRLRRINLVKKLFSYSFTKDEKNKHAIYSKISYIDQKIKDTAPKYPVEKINKIDLAILRLALYELLVEKKEPPKAIINEAIEIAKQYGNEKSPHFINAVLANIYEHDIKT